MNQNPRHAIVFGSSNIPSEREKYFHALVSGFHRAL
jgi:hypothetical protein